MVVGLRLSLHSRMSCGLVGRYALFTIFMPGAGCRDEQSDRIAGFVGQV